MEKELPVESVIPDLKDALKNRGAAVLLAPPGAGKTTRVPLALVHEPWLRGRKIIMLEPRRLAARAAAERMAGMLGEKVGRTVGYRVRLDTRVGRNTRIEVVTEGVLTRLLQEDPALHNVGLVIFDEFHERSLHADLGLAFTMETRGVLREDLRILIMSATLDGGAVAAFMGDVPLIESSGRSFPVSTRYLEACSPVHPGDRGGEHRVATAVLTALKNHGGSILVFLPGEREINRVQRRLEQVLPEKQEGRQTLIAPLYGNLPRKMQDSALEPAPEGKRKIVLATSIAETSLTIKGITVVIDSGWMRVPRFSPGTGMNRLETIRVSRSSADQRRGRAGRVEEGVCYRLWTEAEDRGLVKETLPEIMSADLSPVALEMALWGVSDPGVMEWIDPPPSAAFMQARELLVRLGALSKEGRITTHGKRIAGLGTHPRLGHMLLRGKLLGAGRLSCDLAGILSEGKIVSLPSGQRDSDLRLRLDALHDPGGFHMKGIGVNRRVCRNIGRMADLWAKKLDRMMEDSPGKENKPDDTPGIGALLAFAYPDRVGMKRRGGEFRYRLSGGRGAYFPGFEPIAEEEFIVATSLDGKGTEALIHLAAPIRRNDIEDFFSKEIVCTQSITWNVKRKCVESVSEERFGGLVMRSLPLASPDKEEVARAMMEGIRRMGLSVLPWTGALRNFRARVLFLNRERIGTGEWPDLSDRALLENMENWLYPFLMGVTRKNQLQQVDMKGALSSLVPWHLSRELDAYAPTHLTVPSGSKIPVDYVNGSEPVLAVRVQEMFGLKETPCIGGGVFPLLLHLLSPAGRPLQVTKDLGGFWAGSYEEVKKEMKGRYPKHHWPDNPLGATATSRAKQRR